MVAATAWQPRPATSSVAGAAAIIAIALYTAPLMQRCTAGAATPTLLPAAAATAAGRPPVNPSWPSPLPSLGTSWFGGNLKTFEWRDPREMAALSRYKLVLTGWMELLEVSNFTNATAIDAEQAEHLKAALPAGTAVFSYHNGWIADGFHDETRAIMADLETFGDFFLRNASGDVMTDDTYCAQTGVTPDQYGGRCIAFFWNWCNTSALPYYLDHVLKPLVAYPDGTGRPYDGVFIDQSDFFSTRGASNAKCDPVQARLNVHIQTGLMFQTVGKWPIFSSTLSGAADNAEQDAIWAAGVGYTRFDEFFTPTEAAMASLYNETRRGVPTLIHAPTGVKRHPPIKVEDALATFLVATGGAPHAYFEYSSGWYDNNWQWVSPLFDVEYGVATGPPVVSHPTNATVVWTRHFDHGNVTASVNCTQGVVWCQGNITYGPPS